MFKIINNIDCPRQLKGYLVKRSELCDRNFRDSSLIDSQVLRALPPVNGIRYLDIFAIKLVCRLLNRNFLITF